MIRDVLTKSIQDALQSLGEVGTSFVLEHPGDLTHGDYATNVALVAAKKSGQNPKVFATQLAEYITAHLPHGVLKVEVAGPGFINFYLTQEFFVSEADAILKDESGWGRNSNNKGRRVIVEYAQPNPFKPFHIGHLMSTTVGETISRLVEYSGAEVFRANYQGDIGPHVAMCIWALLKKGLDPKSIQNLGDAYVFGYASYAEGGEAKEEIDSINKKLYAHDPEYREIYDTGRQVSLEHFAELYTVLGTSFEKLFFESESAPVGLAVVEDGVKRGIFESSDGATVFRGEKYGLHTRVFITSKGTPTYETKELGLVELKRRAFPFDTNITTVAVEQDGYFKVVEKAIDELWPLEAGKYTHVTFGMMQLTTGKMSSRKGNIITGESLLSDMREKAHEKMGDRDLGEQSGSIADAIAVAAIKYSILKQGTGKNIIFNPEQSLSFDGDSGPYLQYSHVRALSILKKAEAENVTPSLFFADTKSDSLVRLLYRFPEVVERAEKEREPHHVTTYLTELAGVFNSWYAQEKIVNREDELSSYRVALTRAFAITMKNGLWVLGIQAPDVM